MPKKVQKRKPTKYNKILREFTKINDKLPEEKKLSISERRKIVREQLLPKFSKIPTSKLRIKKNIRPALMRVINKIPPKPLCDVNYLDLSDFALIEYFALDETIRELIPDCVYVKVSAGDYGETKIFNTRDYEYSSKGVKAIVDEIRDDAKNSSGKYIFTAYKKLKANKRNDGSPENYYIDFVLSIIDKNGNEEPQADIEEVDYTPPKGKLTRKIKANARVLIEQKIKKLRSKKASRKRAKKTLSRNLDKFKKVNKKVSRNPSPTNRAAYAKQLGYTFKLIEKYYKEGKLTKLQYEQSIQKVGKELEN